MAIDEARLELFFVNGLESVESLIESLEARIAYRGALMETIDRVPESVPKLPAEIDDQIITMINGNLGELTEEMKPLLTLLNQERTAWAALAKAILEKTDPKELRTVVRGFQKLLEGIHDSERALLPPDVKEMTLQAFLDSMAAVKRVRVTAARKKL